MGEQSLEINHNHRSPPITHSPRKDQRLESNIHVIINDFLEHYSSPDYQHINPTNEELEASMYTEMILSGLLSPHLEKTIHLAASLIELAFHGCTFKEKKMIALFNWYIIYIDEAVLSDPQPCTEFQYRFIQKMPQLDPVLDAFADVLHTLLTLYPPLQANLILTSTLEFVTATCVEQHLAIPKVTAPTSLIVETPRETRFPLFLRERTGLGLPGALLLFSPSQPMDFDVCFRALGDMVFWIAAVNDLLSFFKEQLAGETSTFVHFRAREENRSPLTVLADLASELSTASRNVSRALAADASALRTWRMFEYGVIAWHVENKRYRLRELTR